MFAFPRTLPIESGSGETNSVRQTLTLGSTKAWWLIPSNDPASVCFPGDDTTFTLGDSEKVYTLHPPVISALNGILGNNHLQNFQYHTCPPTG